MHLQREPGRVDEQPDLDLRVDPAFLAHPHLLQGILVLGFEVQGGDVVEDQPQRAVAGHLRQARGRQL